MSRELLLASLGVNKQKVPDVLVRSQAMSAGFAAHSADYPALSPSLAAFQILLANLVAAQQLVPARTVGAAKARNVQLDLLWSAMKSECAYVQTLVDINQPRGLSLIQNAGLVVVTRTLYAKPLLALALGTQPGTVNCAANISLLVGTGTTKPNQKHCLNWQYTLDGSKTFVSAGSTPGSKTVLTGLPSLTLVGVRVCLNTMQGIGAWSQVVTILVH
jgi:hypothetical protein